MKDVNKILSASIGRAVCASMMGGIDVPDPKSVGGPLYHGTCMSRGEGAFDALRSDMSEFNALWVSPNETISETFAMNRCNVGDGGIPVVYMTMHNVQRALPLDRHVTEELMDAFGVNGDPRELIPHMERAGYDGWITMGSLDTEMYIDIAIFKSSVQIDKMKVFTNNGWTDFFEPEEYHNVVSNKMESDHLERFTRPIYP